MSSSTPHRHRISLEEAWARLARELQPARIQNLRLDESLGLRLAQRLVAGNPVPPRSCAEVDGYAVVASALRSLGDGRTLLPADASLLLAGEPLTEGADAVVPVEHVQSFLGGLVAQRNVRPSEHVIPAGYLCRAGETIMDAGSLVTPAALGLLASIGERSLLVHPRPRVAVTGLSQSRSSGVEPQGTGRDPGVALLRALAMDAGADVVATHEIPLPWSDSARCSGPSPTRSI